MADDPRVLALVQQYVERQGIIGQALGLLNEPGRVGVSQKVAANIKNFTQAKLDAICDDVALLLKVPLSTISIVDDKNTFVMGACGMNHKINERDHSYCLFVASSGMDFQIEDVGASEEQMMALQPYREMGVRAYLGRPLLVDNAAVGSLCAVDFVPRQWTQTEHMLMTNYAAHVSSILEEET